jgi:hypothetical protein
VEGRSVVREDELPVSHALLCTVTREDSCQLVYLAFGDGQRTNGSGRWEPGWVRVRSTGYAALRLSIAIGHETGPWKRGGLQLLLP